MTTEWLDSNFEKDTNGDYIVFSEETTQITVNVDFLISFTTSAPPTYEELSALDIAKQGWQKVFDQWKEKGLVS